MKQKFQVTSLLISIVLAELVGALSALFSGNIGSGYQGLNQPPLAPPGWVFPAAWGILYALMGTAAYLIYQSDADQGKKKQALTFYGVQLFFNFLWSIVFFRFGAYWLSVAVIILLDIFLVVTMVLFARIRKAAMYFFIPYLAWVLFATYLDIGVAVLNQRSFEKTEPPLIQNPRRAGALRGFCISGFSDVPFRSGFSSGFPLCPG